MSSSCADRGFASGDSVRPRFVVGIDLGTTNSALCFVDTSVADWRVETFLISQVVAAGEVECLETLPSFLYEALPEERGAGVTRVPWLADSPSSVVGVFARDHGRTLPGRLTESAKSWLCHGGVDRRAGLLPWHAAPDVARLSPVEACSRFLSHLRGAWNACHVDDPLELQDVVLTIPASFDEVARGLTVAAARAAGLPRVVLLEEPQAAFYAWVVAHRDSWDSMVSAGQKILVCDIGGGTTDFSLIHVRPGGGGGLQFHRVAVGDHLLLGGDNLDLALAHELERRLAGGGQLEARQWCMLLSACRHAKEVLLGEGAPESFTVVVSGAGSRLIGGAVQWVLSRDEVVRMFVEGFLPLVDLSERPQRRMSGFQEFGLPYAADPAITKYLASFLMAHRVSVGSAGGEVAAVSDAESMLLARPDVVLFNGGFFASRLLRERLIESLEGWFRPFDPGWTPIVLQNNRLDLAVAQGAAYFGMVRRGLGVRIVAGLARSYYVGVELADGSRGALCLVAAGMESSVEPVVIDRVFKVRVSEPVEFPILVSGTRLTDKPGEVLRFDAEQMSSLPPIRTVLSARGRGERGVVGARLSAKLTEIGTLDLWCEQVDGSRRWQLQFDVRSATETDRVAHTGLAEQSGIVDQGMVDSAVGVLEEIFGAGGSVSPDETMKRLADAIGLSRGDWPPSLLRGMWWVLWDLHEGRRRSWQHEARWLNLVGFCLRPGFGMAADDWRVEESWRVTGGRVLHSSAACLAELRTFCRRISGGLDAGRQVQIASSVLPAVRQRFRQVQSGRGKAAAYASGNHEAAEIWRMLGAFELLDVSLRLELGEMAIDLMGRSAFEPVRRALIWCLGRVGGRVPVYGPLNLVLPVEKVSQWIERLLRAGDLSDSGVQLALMQLSRKTGDRFRDIDGRLRDRLVGRLDGAGAGRHLIELISEGGVLDSEEACLVLGESLPAGLRLA